jgi:hypothetical protein
MEELKDQGRTGNFEVRIGGSDDEPRGRISSGELIHSKRTAGQGRAESDGERAAIASRIQEYLDENL